MGSYTPNYKLYKVDPTVSGNNEYVDVEGQINRNLDIIDDVANKLCRYQIIGNVTEDHISTVGNYPGTKLYSAYDSAIKVWNGSGWVTTKSSSPIWNDVVLSGVFATKPPAVNNLANNVGYYVDSGNNTVYLRGEVVKGAAEAFTQGTTYTVVAAGLLPSPPTTRTFFVSGGSGTSRHANFYILTLLTSGQMNVAMYADNAQTAGSAENYFSLEGLDYALS
jgi:hypothetical protein